MLASKVTQIHSFRWPFAFSPQNFSDKAIQFFVSHAQIILVACGNISANKKEGKWLMYTKVCMAMISACLPRKVDRGVERQKEKTV
jgi:hypothetical protein